MSAKLNAFHEAFTNAVIVWNCVEQEARRLLVGPQQRNIAALVASAHLGNVALTDALRAFAETLEDEVEASHVAHACEMFERIRAYRNYYVHGLTFLGLQGPELLPTAVVRGMEAKGRLALVEADVSVDDIRALWRMCCNAYSYFHALNLRKLKLADETHDGEPDPWPKKPPLPTKLQRRRSYLLKPRDRPDA